MEKAILRIYLPISAKVKEFGIEQILSQQILGGYLNKDQKLAFEQAEVNSPYYESLY